jgi:RNA polymerase sigma factor (sigma-70 family)
MAETPTERFEHLFRATYPAVRGYALRRTSPDAAQDAVAETFLVAWRRFDEVPEDALPWLFGVARRVLANQRRASGRGEALQERLAGAAQPESLEEHVTESEVVRAALARLSERDREALMLVAWHGLSGKRAARAAGCTRTAFDVRLYRARGRLAALLERLDPPVVATNAKSLETN